MYAHLVQRLFPIAFPVLFWPVRFVLINTQSRVAAAYSALLICPTALPALALQSAQHAQLTLTT